MNAHLTDDQLLDRLYGVAEHPHVESCVECSARFRELETRRVELSTPVEVSAGFLAAQRGRISSRIEKPSFDAWKWVPAAVATCVLAIGVLVYRPATVHSPATKAEGADAQLFSDVYSMAQSTEPSAATPIHALFEENE
jgi:hypothetical protein